MLIFKPQKVRNIQIFYNVVLRFYLMFKGKNLEVIFDVKEEEQYSSIPIASGSQDNKSWSSGKI